MKGVESRVPLTGQARFGGKCTHAPKRCDGIYPTESQSPVVECHTRRYSV
jgi:hypothetical protein